MPKLAKTIYLPLAEKLCSKSVTDGRMNAEVIRVLASGRPAADSLYPKTLFTAREAFAGSCTAKSTIYTANIAAGLMVGQFARWLRGWPPSTCRVPP